MIKLENRASVVLYNFLKSNGFKHPFLLPANVCPIVPSVFLKANIEFEFLDIDHSHIINNEIVLEKLSKRNYSGILFVHPYGNLVNTNDFFNQIRSISESTCIIDDRCLCVPETKLTDALADLVLFSTGYSKYIDFDYGGWGVLKNSYEYKQHSLTKFKSNDFDALLKLHKESINNNISCKIPSDLNWLNTDLPNIQENEYFMEIESLLETVHLHKSKLNRIYRDELPLEIQFPFEYQNWRFNLIVENRDELLQLIFKNNLFAGTNYPAISKIFSNTAAPEAEFYSKKILNLFNDFRFQETDALKIAKIINIFIK